MEASKDESSSRSSLPPSTLLHSRCSPSIGTRAQASLWFFCRFSGVYIGVYVYLYKFIRVVYVLLLIFMSKTTMGIWSSLSNGPWFNLTGFFCPILIPLFRFPHRGHKRYDGDCSEESFKEYQKDFGTIFSFIQTHVWGDISWIIAFFCLVKPKIYPEKLVFSGKKDTHHDIRRKRLCDRIKEWVEHFGL